MKKETIIAVLTTVVVIFVILMIVGISSKDKTTSVAPTAVTQEFRGNFIEGCSEDGDVTYTQCACMYDKMLEDKGIDGIADITANYMKTGTIPNDILELVMPCVQ